MRILTAVAVLVAVGCSDLTEPPDPLVGKWSSPALSSRLTGVVAIVTQSGKVLGGTWTGTLEACPGEPGKSCPIPVSGILTAATLVNDAVSLTLDRGYASCWGASDISGRFAGDSIIGTATTRIACTGEQIASDAVVLTRN